MVTLRPYQQAAADKLVGILTARRIAYLRGEVRVGFVKQFPYIYSASLTTRKTG